MGSFATKCRDSHRAFGLAWKTWRTAVDKDQARKTFRKLGCLYCLSFFALARLFCLFVLFTFPITMIVIGAVYFNDCPSFKHLTVYLIVLGCYGILEMIIYILRHFMFCARCDIPLFIWEFSRSFVFGFFVWGSVVIYEMYQPNYNSKRGSYCDKTLYLFSFAIVTIFWICLGLFFIMCLILIIMLACMNQEDDDDD